MQGVEYECTPALRQVSFVVFKPRTLILLFFFQAMPLPAAWIPGQDLLAALAYLIKSCL